MIGLLFELFWLRIAHYLDDLTAVCAFVARSKWQVIEALSTGRSVI